MVDFVKKTRGHHIFLGGSCKNNDWRETVIKEAPSHLKFFDPYREDWDFSCWHLERKFLLTEKWKKIYYIRPDQRFLSISEILKYGNPEWTVFMELDDELDPSWSAVSLMIKEAIGEDSVHQCRGVAPVIDFLNEKEAD